MNIYVKEGYILMSLVMDTNGRDYAIIYRDRTQDYVFCSGYNVKDGTWGAGTYVVTYEAAIKELKKRI